MSQYAKEILHETDRFALGSDPDKETLDETKDDYGLRTAFNHKDKPINIATNYLPITVTAPEGSEAKIYVYHFEYIREIRPNGDQIELKNRHCKEYMFKFLVGSVWNLPEFQSLRDHTGYWVSDNDTIWSVKRLFDKVALPFSVPSANTPATIQIPLQGKDMSDRDFTVERVNISEKTGGALNLSHTVAQLFRNATETATEDDDPAILARGLNSMLTKWARGSAQLDARTQTSANKFYWTDAANQTTLDNESKFQGAAYPTKRALNGYFASVRPSMDRLLLNINTATSPFFEKMTVQEYADRLLGQIGYGARLADHEKDGLESILRGVRVRILYDKTPNFRIAAARVRTITELGRSVNQQNMSASNTTRVYDYFSNPTNATQPLPNTMNRTDLSVNVGTARWKDHSRTAEYYPASQLLIEEFQAVHGALRSKQTENMIEVARKPPAQNAHLITSDGLTMFGINDTGGKAILANYNLEVGPKLIKIPARLLNPPKLLYGGEDLKTPRLAAWNLAAAAFVNAIRINALPILELREQSTSNNAVDNRKNRLVTGLGAGMVEAFKKHGLVGSAVNVFIPFLGCVDATYDDAPTYERELSAVISNLAKVRTDTYLVVIPGKGNNQNVYAAIKRIGDIHLGIKTVCVAESKVWSRKAGVPRDMQYFSNVAMKFNLKGRGRNHVVERTGFAALSRNNECDTIVIGADVAHPLKTASPGCPSIASVVANTDDNFVHFPGSMRLQYGRREFIDKLWDMVKERLIDWAIAHGGKKLPKRILFYRDGVSESQYDAVRQKEIPQLQRAYKLADAYLNERWDEYNAGADDDDDTGKADIDYKSAPQKQDDKPDDAKLTHAVGKLDIKEGQEGSSKAPEQTKEAEATGKLPVGEKAKRSEPPSELSKKEAADALRESKKDFQLTYVIVGKRHNTRFYPTEKAHTWTTWKDGMEIANGNVQPGLLVDQVITHPYSFDFYLQSHQPLAGTGRSAHYFVLTNQMQLEASQLQSDTHAFCYTYAKATRGVSYCAPAYYADRLCDRGRAYLRHWLLKRGDDYKIERGSREDDTEYKARVMRHIYNNDYWRPHRSGTKYGCNRRNPWHPAMDDIMFYL